MAASVDHPPAPYGAVDLDELSARLRRLQVWAGVPYREVHRRVVRARRCRGVAEIPAYNTVYRCLQPGRSRLDVELLVDIATALLGDDGLAAEWRQAHQVVAGLADRAAVVAVSDRLPDDPAGFVGRRAELDQLLADVTAGGPGVVAAIEGMAGVGKTSLAVHAAHLAVQGGRFADLRLAVNLRGFDPELPPADPGAVLDAFLRQLGVAGSEIHALGLAGRSARFRALMAGRQAVLLLDNAATEDQVEPLLPGSPSCLVLVTSRHRLAGLRGARHLQLDVFTEVEALDLLRAAGGRQLGVDDRHTAAEIARLAGHLPLALALVGSRIRTRPDWTLADHLDQSTEHRSRLRLDDGVELALRLSYAALGADQQRLLRLLALHPGRDFDATAAAALAGTGLAATRRQLAELHASSIVQQRLAGRYELHDLVRIFAADQARDEDAGSARRDALTRLLDHYRYAAALAADLYAPQEKHRRPRVADPGTPTPPLADRESATAWLEAERANLISVATYAADHDWPGHAGDLSIILYPFLDLAGYYEDAETLHRRAVEVADERTRGYALNQLGCVYWRTGRMTEAIGCFERGAALFERIGDPAGRGRTVGNLGVVLQGMGRFAESLTYHELAASLFHQTGDQTGESRSTGNAGCARVGLGQYVEALADFDRSLELARAAGDRPGAGATLANMGCSHEKLGNFTEALRYHEDALTIAREVGHRDGETQSITNIGNALAQLDRHDEALEHHRQALAMARASGNRQVEAKALNSVGVSLRSFGRLDDAIASHRQALAIAEELGDLEEVARAYAEIAAARAQAGAAADARDHWERALRVYRDIGAPEADRIEAALAVAR